MKKEGLLMPNPIEPTRRYQTGKHLEAFILLFIYQQPMHGGAILKRLQDELPPVWSIDSGGVYRLLRDLESQGALTSSWVTEEQGAPKRYYHITQKGIECLKERADEIRVRRQSLDLFLSWWEQNNATDD
ncbi:MAG: PadR family transcriptional regulator [Firmicutes bacterium]|jgi:DNA-binding PadR family transcriptional regulator|nr:PadR family transcriptional regulator [Bacillota bacterium]MCL5015571.1 PadR family transcriptional regulator [Bacillota bacterium]